MKFSVIIPIYNSSDYLRNCLDSLLCGNEKLAAEDVFELVLIDDGSSDGSGDICREYAGKYGNIKFISQKNSGPAAARNNGIEAASGDYLTFVDSDDMVSKDYFNVLNETIEKTNSDLVFFGIRHIGKNGEILRTFPDTTTAVLGKNNIIRFITDHFESGDLNSTANKAFSSSLFKEKGLRYPDGTVVEEDLLMVLRAIDLSASLSSISNGLYLYQRRESGSVTTKYNPDKFDCKGNAYREEIEWAKKNYSPGFEKIFNENYLTYISACINNLLYSACPLSRKEKLKEIRRFYSSEDTLECISRTNPSSARGKMMLFLIKHRLIRTSLFIHSVVFQIKRR